MTDPWRELGLSPGADRRALRRAYAARLRDTHPEDDPEGFMRLREAYETLIERIDDRERVDRQAAEPPPAEAAFADGDSDGRWREPETASSQPPEPPAPSEAELAEQARIQAEIASLEARMATLGASLAGEGPRDDDAALAAFEALLAEPAMERIDIRGQVEFWLSDLMAHSVPRSDAILRETMAAFGWDTASDTRNRPQAIGYLLSRLDEWGLIASLDSSDHPYHRAFRILSRKRPIWWRRIDALEPRLVHQIGEVIAIADYQMPGLMHSLDPEAVDWWRARLGNQRPTMRRIAVPAIGAGLAIGFVALLENAPPTLRYGVAALPLLVSIPLFVLAARVDRLRQKVAEGGPWLRDGWAVVAIFLPLVLLALPPQPGGVATAALLALVTFLWMLAAHGGRRAEREINPLSVLVSVGVFGVAGAVAAFNFQWPYQALLAITALFVLAVRWLAIHDIAYLFQQYLTGWKRGVPGAVMIGLSGGLVLLSWQAAGPPAFVRIAAVISTVMLIASAGSRHSTGFWRYVNWFGRTAVVIAFLIAVTTTVDRRPTGRAESVPTAAEALIAQRSGGTGSLVVPARDAILGLRIHDPEAAARIDGLLDEANRPLATAETHQALSQAVRDAFVARMDDAPNHLIGEEFRLRIEIFGHLLEADPEKCAEGVPEHLYGTAPEIDRRVTRLTLTALASPSATPQQREAGRPITEDRLKALRAKVPPVHAGEDAQSRCRARIAEMRLMSRFGTDDLAKTLRMVREMDAGSR